MSTKTALPQPLPPYRGRGAITIFTVIAILFLVGAGSATTVKVWPNASGFDGYVVRSTNGTFTAIHDGAGVTNDASAVNLIDLYRASTGISNDYNYWSRIELSLRNGSIPMNATIQSAVFRGMVGGTLGVGLGNTSYAVTQNYPGSVTAIASADYNIAKHNNTILSDWQMPKNIKTRVNWTFNANGTAALQNAITNGKNFNISIRSQWDINNAFNGTWASAASTSLYINSSESLAQNDKPYLEVVYTQPTPVPTPSTPNRQPAPQDATQWILWGSIAFIVGYVVIFGERKKRL